MGNEGELGGDPYQSTQGVINPGLVLLGKQWGFPKRCCAIFACFRAAAIDVPIFAPRVLEQFSYLGHGSTRQLGSSLGGSVILPFIKIQTKNCTDATS